jgi:Skp family chaperone for outer membrane proteins
MMKRWLGLFLLGVAMVPSFAGAAGVSVAVVNFTRLQTEAPQAIRARERIDSEFMLRKAKIDAAQKQIAQLEQRLADSEKLQDLELKSLQRDVRSRTLRLENAREELENDRRLRASEESDRLRRIVAEVIAEVANAEKVDVVLESGVITWASERANITDKVLARMQELDKAAK